MNNDRSNAEETGPRGARVPYEWVLERQRKQRRARRLGMAAAVIFLGAIAAAIAFDFYFTAVN